MSADALAPDHFARHRLPTSEDTVVLDGVEQITKEQEGRLLRRVLLGLPDHLQLRASRPGRLGVEHFAWLAWPDGQHLAAGKSGGREYEPVTSHGPRGAGVAGALFHAPQFGAGQGIIGIQRL